MLFTALLKVREGSTNNERIMRRVQYSFPEGCRPVTEYWLQTTDPSLPHVVATFESDSVEPVMALLADWDDHFHITVAPAITSEDGLKAVEQMMQAGHAVEVLKGRGSVLLAGLQGIFQGVEVLVRDVPERLRREFGLPPLALGFQAPKPTP